MCWQWWREEVVEYKSDPSRGFSLIFLSVATSIDALAAGASLGLLGASVRLSASILAAMTVALAITGLAAGQRLGKFFGRWGMLAGGIVLVALGLKVVIEHLQAG